MSKKLKFPLLSGCGFLKKFKNEKSFPHILQVVLLIGSVKHITITTKHLKKDEKSLPTTHFVSYPQSAFTHNLGSTLFSYLIPPLN